MEANRWQVFYHNPDVPEMHWTAILPKGRNTETDNLYVVFSPNRLFPPVAGKGEDTDLQRYQGKLKAMEQLSFKEFQKFLGKLQRRDQDVQVERRIVRITSRQ